MSITHGNYTMTGECDVNEKTCFMIAMFSKAQKMKTECRNQSPTESHAKSFARKIRKIKVVHTVCTM